MIEFLKEDNGLLSSVRLIMCFSYLMVLMVWSVVSVYNGQLLPIPESIVWLLGFSSITKVTQKMFEH